MKHLFLQTDNSDYQESFETNYLRNTDSSKFISEQSKSGILFRKFVGTVSFYVFDRLDNQFFFPAQHHADHAGKIVARVIGLSLDQSLLFPILI